MKKIIYSLFVILALSCTFVSCSDDDGDAPAPAGNPAEAAAGTYTGTWCRVLNNDTVRGEGALTIAPTDSMYCADFTFEAPTLDLKASSVANIAFAGADGKSFSFNNTLGADGLGDFYGQITNGVATVKFSKEVRVGRKRNIYNFSFEGTK